MIPNQLPKPNRPLPERKPLTTFPEVLTSDGLLKAIKTITDDYVFNMNLENARNNTRYDKLIDSLNLKK